MKKTLFFLITLIFLGFISIQAQDTLTVSGYVTNELNGNPVVNHDVSIMLNDSSFYNSTVATDQNGYYMDYINTTGFTVTSIYIHTNDLCTYGIHDTLIQNPGSQVYADFEICVDTVTNPECQADFYYVSDSLGQNTIQFIDNSTSTLTINSWTWDFGDGNTSTVQNPIHNYANAGTYNVCLTIESSDSGVMCTDSYCMDVVVQTGGGNDCLADFYHLTDSTGGNYTIVNFYDLSTPVGLIDTWYWDFDDGTTSSEQNPVHAYNTSGNFNVCLTITSGSGSCTSTTCMIVQVQGGTTGDCEADFYYTTEIGGNFTVVHFYDLSTPVGLIDTWYWDFGDNVTSTEQNPVHNYTSPGTYNVCLTIESNDSGVICTDTYCMDVVVQTGGGNDCMADFYHIIDSTGGNYTIVNFYDLSTPVGLIESWFWDFDDGTTSSEQNPVHAYNTSGYFNVCLTIISDSGSCTSTQCMIVQIQGGSTGDCEADFYYTTDSTGGNYTVVQFYDLSIPASLINTWHWDFGDGATSSEQNPVHAYNATGVYNVCLTITTDSMFCTSTYCESINIQTNDNFYLGGNVFADIYQLDHGFAYAYKEENGVITEVFSNIIDSLGYYLFYPMTEADYYAKVEPSPTSAYFGTYMPTYYGDVALWGDAVLINLVDNVYTADINLIPLNQSAAGSGSIAGSIYYGGTIKADTPAVGIQIMLANEEGEFVALVYSDEEGKFEFPALAYGTFTLYAEVMGINMTPKDFTLTQENYVVDDISMIITDDQIYFGPDGIESFYIDDVSEVYPNPLTNNLKLDIGIKNPTRITAKIYNQVGQTLIMEQFNIGNSQTIEVNTSRLKSGMYFLEIIADDNYRIARKFIKR